jgi:uncharacterized membrane protein YhaH (DUF805 family)
MRDVMTDFINVMRRWNDFGGRSSRKEYWMFALWYLLILVLLSVLDNFVFGPAGAFGGTKDIDSETTVTVALNFYNAFYLLTLVPSISVSVRRLHDINRTGWWLLISLTIVGIIPLLYWAIKPGDESTNRFS